MNTLKSILLSSVLITTTFGADMVRPTDLTGDAPARKAHRTEAAPLAVTKTAGQDRLRGKNGRFVKVKKTKAAAGVEVAAKARKAPQAEAAAIACPPLPGEVWARIAAFLPMSESAVARSLSKLPELCMSSKPTEAVINDRALLQQNWGNIIASLLCSNTPVHEVMEANGFDDPRYLMSMIGIKEDTFKGMEVGRYEHTDRKEIAAKLATYAEKFNVKAENIITAADIVEGKEVQDGDLVVLSYNDMLTHKATLDGKDIHLCVDVHADANGKLVWDNNHLPRGLKKLYIQNTQKDVISIRDAFLAGCIGLTQVNLSAFKNVTCIGEEFLFGCKELSSVDLSPLSKVTSVGGAFLALCSGLTQVDLSPLSNVTSVGDRFLGLCKGLTHIDLSPLSKVTTIGHAFLVVCTGLTQADLSPLSKVTSIGSYFLSNCSGLTHVDLSGLTKVISIGEGFLYECIELSSVDLSPLRNLTKIERSTLSGCVKLKEVKIPKGVRVLEDKTCHLTAKKIMVD